MSFVEKLNAVVADLRANADIFVAHYQVLPADLAAIDKVEVALGYKLADTIRDFYTQCGGVQLLWIHESNDSFDHVKENFHSQTPLDNWYIKGEHISFFPEGCIWIPSIEAVFLTDWAANGLEFDADDFDQSISHNFEGFKIQVFDWFSTFNDVAFLINGTANPPLVLGDDNQATYNDSHLISFDLYLDLLLKSKGDKEMRSDFLNIYNNDAIDGYVTTQDIAQL